MTAPDLLILAAFDFSDGSPWFADGWERAVGSLLLGKAGSVRHLSMGQAAFAARELRPKASTSALRPRRGTFARQADGSHILLAGEIYEADDLRRQWGISACDNAALYAEMHSRFGDDCDRHVVGDYAVVQWFPDLRKVRIARSPTSRAPLHVLSDGSRLVVSSLPGPVFAIGHDAAIDNDMLGDWLLLNASRPRQSWYQGMHRLPAGWMEIYHPGSHKARKYWSVRDVPKVRYPRDEDYVEAIDEQFTRATKAMLGKARSPGVMLSGGLDSQAVASFAAAQLGDGLSLRSYTSVPQRGWDALRKEGVFGDESEHVRALCAMYPNIVPTFIEANSLRFGDRLQSLILLSGWPIYNEMNAHWGHAAMEAAAAEGVDLMLGGSMGNASFSYDGATGFPTWLASGQWVRLLRELRALTQDTRPIWRKFASLAVFPHVPRRIKMAIDKRRAWRTPPFETWCSMREDYAKASGAIDRAWQDRHDLEGYASANALDWRDEVVTGMLAGAPEIALGFTLLYGIPMRDPTAFCPLVELCAGIGDEQYLRDGVDRWLARRLLERRVPEMVWNERRIGQQSADWPIRFQQERAAIMAELDAIERDPRLAEVFDVPRLKGKLHSWDGRDVPERRDSATINSGIARGIATARFVKFVEGRNVG